jgi:hypothetical protein
MHPTLLKKTQRKAPLPTLIAHGPELYPRPNNSVRVRTAGLALKGLWPGWTRAELNRAQPPVACSSRPLQGIRQPGPGEHTQTPGATPRKVSRIPESCPVVNETRPGVVGQFGFPQDNGEIKYDFAKAQVVLFTWVFRNHHAHYVQHDLPYV